MSTNEEEASLMLLLLFFIKKYDIIYIINKERKGKFMNNYSVKEEETFIRNEDDNAYYDEPNVPWFLRDYWDSSEKEWSAITEEKRSFHDWEGYNEYLGRFI